MVGNYFTLQALTSEAAETLKGARILEAFSQDRAELILIFQDPFPALVISCRPESSTFFFHPGFQRAKRNSTDVLPDCHGLAVQAVTLNPLDRVITLSLDHALRLVFLCFGPSSNVLLLSQDGVVRDAFLKSKELMGTTFSESGAERIVDLHALHELTARFPGFTMLAALRKLFPLFAQPLAEEILFRSHIDASATVSGVTTETIDALTLTIQQILVELQHPEPRVYLDEETRRAVLSVVGLRALAGLEERRFTSVHEAVRVVVARRRADRNLEARRNVITGHIRQAIEKSRRALTAVTTDGKSAELAEVYSRYGSLLLSNNDSVGRGDRTATMIHNGEPITIPLDPRLSQVQNAQRYFEKAKRSKTAAAEGAERKRELEKRIASGESLLNALAEASTSLELKQIMTDRKDELDEFGIGDKGETAPLPFRRFIVDGGFEVLAGKSSENNDELTLHVAKPHDLWFHARGSSGSHVVLRVATGKGEPGKKARTEAAAIAAYYSKMKSAGLVPVAMTEKRYVRKPKGAKPGSVVLEREKVLFVHPALPESGRSKHG